MSRAEPLIPKSHVRLAWLPIPVLLILIVVLAIVRIEATYESQRLILVLNFLFSTLASVLVIILAGRGFLSSGAPGLLALGCGALLWGAAGTVGSALLAHGVNAGVSVHNLLVWFAALCHLAGAILSLQPGRVLSSAGIVLPAAYTLAVSAAGLVAAAVLQGWLPVFFVPGEGGTPFRTVVLGSAILMFAATAALLRGANRRRSNRFLHWYMLALLLIATSLFGVMLQAATGSALNWTARAAQFLGGVYMFLAACAAVRETGGWRLSLDAAKWDDRVLKVLTPEHLLALPPLWRYTLALAMVAAATALRAALLPWLGALVPYNVWIVAVAATTALLGIGPGLFATLSGIAGVEMFVLDSLPAMFAGETVQRMGFTAVTGLLVAVILHSIRVAALKARRAEERISRHNTLLGGLGRILNAALTSATEEDLGRICVAVAEETTRSKFGFIGEIGADGLFHAIAVSDPGWEACAMFDGTGHRRPLGNFKVHGLYGRVLSDGKPLFTNDPASHPDSIGLPEGHPRLTAFLGAPLTANGKIIGMVAVGNREGGYAVEDMELLTRLTGAIVQAFERKRSEQALALAVKKYTTMFNTTSDGVWLHNLQGEILEVNEAYCFMSGYSREELTHMSINSLEAEESSAAIAARIQDLLRQGGHDRFESRHRRQDGSIFDVDITALYLDIEDGRIAIFIRDITKRKQAVEQFRSSEHFTRRVLNQLFAFVGVLSPDGAVIEANEAPLAAAGLTLDDVRGKKFWDCAWWNYDPAVQSRLRVACQAAAKGEIFRYDVQVRTAGDTRTWIDFQVGPLKDDQGRVTHLIPSAMVLTERKQAENEILQLNEEMTARNVELEVVNKELESFIYSISHDLRAPARHMAGFAEILLEDYRDRLDGTGQDYLRRIIGGADKMRSLIDDLLRLSRISKQEMRRESVDLGALALAVASSLKEAEPDRGIDLSIAEGITAVADRGLLEIALVNLLDNAWKFTAKTAEAKIEFGAKPEGTGPDGSPGPVYFIKDNGAGFKAEHRDKLFLPFHRLHPEREFAGTGIGLAIVERIIHRHGGRIWADGDVGRGATFYFTLG